MSGLTIPDAARTATICGDAGHLIRDDAEEREVVIEASLDVVGHLELLTEPGHGKVVKMGGNEQIVGGDVRGRL